MSLGLFARTRVVVLVAASGAIGLGGGCSSSNLPAYLGSGTGDTNAPSSGGGGDDDASVDTDASGSLASGASTVATCNLGPDGGVCACSDVQPVGDPPNLYFVLDRSASMSEDNKWSTVRTVVTNIMKGIGPRAYFAASIFPNTDTGDECALGKVVFGRTQGDSPAGTYGPAASAMYAATNVAPNGGTPTAATLTALLPTLKEFSGKTFVILATDGGPNCNGDATCDVTACVPNIEDDAQEGCTPTGPNCCAGAGGGANCLDTDASVQAVAALKASGFPVYVVGLPGSGPYASVLDQLAQAGGTARSTEPLYYAASSTNVTDINAALSQVAAKIIGSCTVTLATTPPDPSLVNVYLDSTVLPKDPTNGWSISGATVTLLGSACQEVLAGDVLDVRVVAGCPTVIR